MKLLLITITLFISANANAWNQTPPLALASCNVEAPYGVPTGKTGITICRRAYVTLNDTTAKLPIWTVYTLTPQESLGCIARTNAFTADQSLPTEKRALPSDYIGTGYDKGHVAPDGDMSWDIQVEYESFLMTNMMPQLGRLNRGIWKSLETNIRGWSVQRNTNITVYAGPIYNNTDKTIGKNKVVVPRAFYKIVIDTRTNEVLSFIFPHSNNLTNDLSTVEATVAEIEKQTGLKFPLPKNAILTRSVRDFPVDFGALTNAKKLKCKR